jgi:hypothetical protein
MANDKQEVMLPGSLQGLMKNVQGRTVSEDTAVPIEMAHEFFPERRPVGRPKVNTKPLERTSITLDPEVMGKLRSLALNTGRQLNSIIEEALVKYFDSYERKNGEIVIPEIYRKG